jgi:alpha-beta hydrolase superfamily lysophospholipase
VFGPYLTVYRTLADPAYLDLSIDPDDRSLGSVFAVGDPLVANHGYGGLARTMTARGWLSTWSGLSSEAALASTMPQVTCPTLVVHPTGDTEIRLRQVEEMVQVAGADDLEVHHLPGAPHYLGGHRRKAADLMVGWLRARFP